MEDNKNIEEVTVSTEQETDTGVPEVEVEVDNGIDGIPDDIIDDFIKEEGLDKGVDTESAVVPSNEKEIGTDEDIDVPNQKIPYSRFKQKVDEANALKAELDELRKLNEQLKAQRTQQVMQQPQMQQPVQAQQSQQPFKFTAEVSQAIEHRVTEVAMEMCGLSKEDIDAMEFADDGDASRAMFENAKILARQSIISDIRKQASDNLRQQQAYRQAQMDGMSLYRDFTSKEQAEPEYPQILAFATNEYLNTLTPFEQSILGTSYQRMEQGIGTPQDASVVLGYYRQAKQQYLANKSIGNPTAQQPVVQAQKKKVSPSKFDQIGGTVSTEAVTASTLENMLNTMPWEKIPEHIRNMMLEGDT